MIMFAPKRLNAYREIDDNETTIGLRNKALSVSLYFKYQGYKIDIKSEGCMQILRYENPDGEIIMKQGPEPSPKEFKRLRHEWEFRCPSEVADVHIGNLKQTYREIGFNIDE